MIGNEYRTNRGDADDFNNKMIMDKISMHSSKFNESEFPKTSNQDFHSAAVFQKAITFGNKIDKTNFKRQNPYAAFVNAQFNSGVFVNPW